MGDKTAVDGDLREIRGEGRRTRERLAHTPSTLFKADGSCPEPEERNQGLLFSSDSDLCWGGFSFSFQFCCKTVIEVYRFHLHLSPLLLSLWSTACLPSVCAS